MANERTLLEDIKRLIKCEKYRIRIHAIRHMIEEGFNEEDNENAKGINGTALFRMWRHIGEDIYFSGI